MIIVLSFILCTEIVADLFRGIVVWQWKRFLQLHFANDFITVCRSALFFSQSEEGKQPLGLAICNCFLLLAQESHDQ